MCRQTWLALGSVLVVCCLLGSCSDDGSPTSVDEGTVVTEISAAPQSVSIGDEVTVTISWSNETDERVTLYFDSFQNNDFAIFYGTSEIAHHSGVYDEVSGEYRLAPGMSETNTFTFVFDPSQSSETISWNVSGDDLQSGTYSIQGGIFGYESEYAWDSAELEVSD